MLFNVAIATLPATAQITGDNSIGTQVNGSLTAPCSGSCPITAGATRGGNLFHSFQQFSLPNGDIADFQFAPTIQNVIVRVTGVGQPFISNLNGTIQTNNSANFFLLNPNGIIFGPGATLNIGGSFLATTASQMQFQDGTQFTTTEPTSLLSISLPIGVQFGQNPGSIQLNRAQLLAGQTDTFRDFTLAGGDITLDNSAILLPGSRLNLAAVGDNSSISLQLNGDRLSLSSPQESPRRNIALTNGSTINASATSGGGEIIITGQNISLENSAAVTRILPGLENSPANQSGDIKIDASGNFQLNSGSILLNQVRENAIGQGGNIYINVNTLSVSDESQILAISQGQGNAGEIAIQAQNEFALSTGSSILNRVNFGGVGNIAGIAIQAQKVSLTEGSQIQANNNGQGNSNGVAIQARNISIDGVYTDGFVSGIFSQIGSNAIGKGGNITINTDSIALTNGGLLTTTTRGQGDAGKIVINALGDILVDGIGPKEASQIASTVGTNGIGSGGDIEIMAKSFFVTNGGDINASTFGQGNGGNITVKLADRLVISGVNTTNPSDSFASSIGSEVGNDRSAGIGNAGAVNIVANSVAIINGANITNTTRSVGNAGKIDIQATGSVLIDGIGDDGSVSVIESGVASGAIGNGANVTVNAESISVKGGGRIVVATEGTGNAGNINLQASRSIAFDNAGASSPSSGAFATVNPGGIGQGGNINVTAPILSVVNGAGLVVSTSGKGDGGNITIRASDRVLLDGVILDPTGNELPSRVFSRVRPSAVGNGGKISIVTDSLTLANGAQVSSSSDGDGSAGTIGTTTRLLKLEDRAGITTETSSGNGGSITLEVGELLLMRHGSLISTTAGAAQSGGNGGNITIHAPAGFLITAPNENNDITANAFNGSGGKVTINAQGIYWFTPRSRADLVQLLSTTDPAQLDPRRLPSNDITAISQGNPDLSGSVTLNILNVDPSRGLTPLDQSLVDPTTQISQNCRASMGQGSFVMAGRGGIPLLATDPNTNRQNVAVWIVLPNASSGPVTGSATHLAAGTTAAPLVEAQGWYRDALGSMNLVALSPEPVAIWAGSPCK